MTDHNATPAFNTARPAKTLADYQHDAVILAGMLRGIDLMETEGKLFDDARTCITLAALARAEALANDLDRLTAQRMDTGKPMTRQTRTSPRSPALFTRTMTSPRITP